MMRDAGIAVVRLGHLAWDTFEPADGEFRFEWFDEVMDLMRDNGIGVILDIAVRPAPLWPRRRTSPRNLRYIQISRLPRPRRYDDQPSRCHSGPVSHVLALTAQAGT
jgi:beta-galactosidase